MHVKSTQAAAAPEQHASSESPAWSFLPRLDEPSEPSHSCSTGDPSERSKPTSQAGKGISRIVVGMGVVLGGVDRVGVSHLLCTLPLQHHVSAPHCGRERSIGERGEWMLGVGCVMPRAGMAAQPEHSPSFTPYL